jgi:hypothetical protein
MEYDDRERLTRLGLMQLEKACQLKVLTAKELTILDKAKEQYARSGEVVLTMEERELVRSLSKDYDEIFGLVRYL